MTRSTLGRLVVLAAIWGTSFLFIKIALGGLSTHQVVLGRLVGGAVALAALSVVRREPFPALGVAWAHLFAMAIAANIVPFFLFAWAQEQGVPSGMAGVFNGSTPLFTLAIAVAFLPEERLTPARGLGFVLGFAGVVVTLAPWRTDGGSGPLLAQLACIGAAACYGVSFNWTRRHLTGIGVGPIALAACQIGIATVLQVGVVAVAGWETPQLDLAVILTTLSLGVLGTGVAYAMYYSLIQDAGATTASLVTYMVPVVAVSLGVIVAGEALGLNLPIGAALVVLGVAVAEGRIGRARRRADPLGEAAAAPTTSVPEVQRSQASGGTGSS